MDIRAMRYFLAIAETENVSKAAEQLHMSQPPLTRQMKQLEEEKVRAEKKARLYFWAGIVVSILCMFGGYLLGKFC